MAFSSSTPRTSSSKLDYGIYDKFKCRYLEMLLINRLNVDLGLVYLMISNEVDFAIV